MTDQLKLIVNALKEPPFEKNYNLISFDGLEPMQLLQPTIDIRSEASDQTALRIFTSLRLLKFRPPSDPDELSIFRSGLVEGEQTIVWTVLDWLLSRVSELQHRAYLSRYLIRLSVPAEFQSQPEVFELCQECEEMMEQFKEVHKEAVAVKKEGINTADVRADLQQMETEKEQLRRRIERVRRKAESVPNKDDMLTLASKLRGETERENGLTLHKQEQRTALVHAEQKLNRLANVMRDLEKDIQSAKPEDLIKKLDEENKIQSYMVMEKLPKEIKTKRKAVEELSKVLAQPVLDKTDLDAIIQKISDINNEVNDLVEKRNVAAEPMEDKLSIFRQQGSMVERKKEAAAERLTEARDDLDHLEAEVREKKSRMRDPEGNEIVTSVQFKNYVQKLRNKTNVYKKKRSQLQDMRAEIGVLARTQEILKSQKEAMKKALEENGDEMVDGDLDGDGGDRKKEIARPHTASTVGANMVQLRDVAKTLDETLSQNQQQIKVIYASLAPLRSDYQDVTKLRKEVNSDQSRAIEMEIERKCLEGRSDMMSESDGHGMKSRLEQRIQDREKLTEDLRTQQASGTIHAEGAARQIKLWRDLHQLMELKKQHAMKRGG